MLHDQATSGSSDELVVIFVAADPNPLHCVAAHPSDCSVMRADADREEISVFQLLNLSEEWLGSSRHSQ